MSDVTARDGSSFGSVSVHGNGPAGIAYRQLLAGILSGPEDERPLLLLMATSSVRPWELLDPATRIADGCMHVAASTFNNVTVPARVVPLPDLMVEAFAGREGTVFDVLGEDPRRRGALMEVARTTVSELEHTLHLHLEELFVMQLAALMEAAPTPAHVEAVTRNAGMSNPVASPNSTSGLTCGGPYDWSARATNRHLQEALNIPNAQHSHPLGR